MPGKTISLYIMDDDSRNLMTAELGQWTGKAYIGDRRHLGIVSSIDELSVPAVYFLLGKNEDDNRVLLYVGEADEANRRIAEHKSKDWWDRFVVFLSKDANLTKAHVRHLEQQMYVIAMKNETTISLKNVKTPGGAKLPKPSIDEMQVYQENMIFILSNLGIIDFTRIDVDKPEEQVDEAVFLLSLTNDRLDSEGNYFVSKMVIISSGYRLLAGSYLEEVPRESFGRHNYFKLRMEIENSGVVTKTAYNGVLLLTRDVDFKSPSAAAAVVKNRAVNGRKEWKTAEGVTLDEYESR